MKLKENFVLRQVAKTWIVLPLAGAADFSGMLTLNDSGALLWHVLEKGGDRQSLADALTAEYEVSEAQALEDVDAFLNKLRDAGCLA